MKFVDLPDDAFERIAKYSSPPDVYSLCLTSKRFHNDDPNASTVTDMARGGKARKRFHNDAPNASTTIDMARGDKAPNASIATKLLRYSLLSSLDHVLYHSKAKLRLEQLSLFSELPMDSVLLSGSIMVQCVLGLQTKVEEDSYIWQDSDIDIFCTPQAAPAVRSWLVKEAGQLFQGFNDHYVGVDNLATAGNAFQNRIHHVEHYCKCPVEGQTTPYSNSFHYENACRWGQEINENYFPTPWQRVLYNQDDFSSDDYPIEPLPGDSFPFDYEYAEGESVHRRGGSKPKKQTAFDLVVSTMDCSSSRELLGSFDLDICKVSWNGNTFSIPNPHFTFASRSRMEPRRESLMKEYQQHYDGGDEGAWPTDDEGIVRRIRRALRSCVFLDEDVARHQQRILDAPTDEKVYAFHNFIFKLFERLKKYQDRGIEVKDAPDTTDFSIRGFDDLDMSEALWLHLEEL